jgi:hypothetical protein
MELGLKKLEVQLAFKHSAPETVHGVGVKSALSSAHRLLKF